MALASVWLAVSIAGCGGGDDASSDGSSVASGAATGQSGVEGPTAEAGSFATPITTAVAPLLPASGTSAVVPRLADGTRAVEPVLSSIRAKDVPASPGADAASKGAWSSARAWPVIAIHAALLSDGRLMTYGTDRNGKQGASLVYDVWDPAAARLDQGHLTLDNTTGTDIFCSAQTVLPLTGQLLIAGGDIAVNGASTNAANPNTTLFDPVGNTLARSVDMNRPRWYSSVTTLANGATYVQGGLSGSDFPELRLTTGGHQLLGTAATGGLDYWYPRNFVAPDGRVFGFDVQGRMYFVDAQGTGSLERLDNLVLDVVGTGSSAVMYAPGRVLQIGGNTPRSAVIDFNGALPVVTETAPLAGKRFWVSGTVLPDGRVLATGGSAVENTLAGADNRAALWNPATGTWTLGASGAFARLYHSVAILLPDATVLVAGGGAPGPLINTNAEIYYPPYLFNAAGQLAPRPQIASAPATLAPGERFAVDIAIGSTPDRLVLIRTGSVTHSVNFDQRRIALPVQRSGNRIDTQLPRNPAIVPPGYYLMFAIDAAGVPSVAKIVRVAPGQPGDIDADWTGRLGGHGAAAYRLECPAGEAAVGVHGSVGGGSGIASIGPRCVALRADGQWEGSPVNRGVAGVAGATAFSRTCEKDSALVGLRGSADATVNALVLSCRPLDGAGRVKNARVELATIGTATGTARPYRSCGFDHPAYALYGTAGATVQSLGLLCRGDPEGAGPNQAPIAASPGFQVGKIGTAVALQIVASDPDGQALAYSAVNLPAGLLIDRNTGRITGTPTALGSRSVTVTVSDGQLDAIVGFDWEIYPAGDNAPVLRSPGNQQSFVGSAVSLALQGFDPDGRPLAYSAVGLPNGLALHPASGLVGGTPTGIGRYAVTVSASDGTRSTQVAFDWDIVSQTAPPETCNRLSNGDFERGTAGWELEATVAIVAGGRNGTSAAQVANGWIGSRATVFADDRYEVSFFHRSTGSGWAGMGVDFFDAAGTNIGAKTGTLPVATSFAAYQMIVSPPAGTAVMRFWVYAADARVLTIDDVDLRRVGCGGPAPPADACNKIGNPGFEAGTTGWERNATTTLVGTARAGAAALSLTDGWIGYRVPAAAGQSLTASGWFKVGPQGWAGMGIDFLDAAGNEIRDYGGTLSETDAFLPYQLTATAPAGTAFARLWVWASPGLDVVVDEAALKITGCGEAVVDPCNRLPNPGFELGLTDWEREADTAIVAGARSGSKAVTVSNGWIGSRVVGVPNRQYSGRIHFQRSTSSGYAVMGIDYFDGAGNDLGETVQVLGPSTGWTAASVTGTAPAGTASIRLWFYVDGDLTLTVDDADLREADCAVPPPAQPCNAVANPGFEEGFAGWQLDAYARTVVDSRTGSKAAQFRGGWIGATGPVQAGAAYVASAHAKVVGAAGWAAIGVKWFDAAGGELRDDAVTIENRTAYDEVVLPVTAPAGAVRARLWLYAVGGKVMTVDDVGLRRVGCVGG